MYIIITNCLFGMDMVHDKKLIICSLRPSIHNVQWMLWLTFLLNLGRSINCPITIDFFSFFHHKPEEVYVAGIIQIFSVCLRITRGLDVRPEGSICLLGPHGEFFDKFFHIFASTVFWSFKLISPTIQLSEGILESISQSVSILCWLLPGLCLKYLFVRVNLR